MFSCICILSMFVLSNAIDADPCTSYTLLSGQYRRSSSYTLQASDIAISDNFLTSGWYRFDSGAGNDMVTSAPSMTQCGTIYPIWMQGTLPEGSDEVTRTACIVWFNSPCRYTLSIKVKSCRGFRVYYLVPPSQTSTGYCIGEESPCPAGQSSSTGFTPCQGYTPVDIDPTVMVSLEYIDLFPDTREFHTVGAVFQCQYPVPSRGPYRYDTYWYINNDVVKVVESRPYQDNQSWLYPRDWIHQYNMNMVVKCSVRVRSWNDGVPGHQNYSQEFKAGMFSPSSTYAVKEGETISIELTVTVPVGCYDSFFPERCKTKIFLLTPEYESAVGSCQSLRGQGEVSFEENECGILIESSTWWHKKTLNVTGKTDGLINVRDRDINIRLGAQTISAEDPSGVWYNFTMPDIKIHLYDVEKNIANKLCFARTDPRMGTFDGKSWTAQLAGEFIMYRDVRRKIAVHALFSSCTWQGWRGEGPCGCGIAVRVEDSLFIYRTCQEISYRFAKPLIHHDTVYHICDNRHMVVDIGNPLTKITLPTGAKVKYRVGVNWLYDISITPSIFDEDNVDGLCGNPNNDQTDDFTPRGSSSSTTNKNVFQSSWRVDIYSSESLFGSNSRLNNSHFERQKHCDCVTEISSATDLLSNHYSANCSIATQAVLCSQDSFSKSFTSTCDRHQNRYKRDVTTDYDDVKEVPPLELDPQFDFNFSPPVPTWKNGWTESTARTHCENAILSDFAVVECQKYIPMESRNSEAVEECVLDIRDSGTTEFVSYTAESLNRLCFDQIKNYEIFYSPNDTQTESVIDTIGKMVCPGNCSTNGFCSAGVCKCSSSFVGVDCSHARSTPPVNVTLPEKGLCRTSKRPCTKTNIYGYFQSDIVHIRFLSFEISDSGKSASISTHTTKATYVSLTIIKAELPTTSRSKRSYPLYGRGFDISLSYDGINFGDIMPLVIFNDKCYNCSAITLECNKTMPCAESTTTQQTTKTTSESTPNPENDDISPVLIIIPCVIVFFLAIAIVLLYLKLRSKTKPSPLYLGVYAVEYNKPPTQHYLNIQLDHPHFSSTGYESIKPGPHNGGTDSTSRPKTASANSLAFDKIPDKRIENN